MIERKLLASWSCLSLSLSLTVTISIYLCRLWYMNEWDVCMVKWSVLPPLFVAIVAIKSSSSSSSSSTILSNHPFVYLYIIKQQQQQQQHRLFIVSHDIPVCLCVAITIISNIKFVAVFFFISFLIHIFCLIMMFIVYVWMIMISWFIYYFVVYVFWLFISGDVDIYFFTGLVFFSFFGMFQHLYSSKTRFIVQQLVVCVCVHVCVWIMKHNNHNFTP